MTHDISYILHIIKVDLLMDVWHEQPIILNRILLCVSHKYYIINSVN